jgi:plastocyanin
MRRLVTTVVLSVVLTTGLAACGRDQDPGIGDATPSGPPQTELTVVAKNTAFDPTKLTAPVGKELTITFRNEDPFAHSFHLSGGSVGEIKTDVKPGPSTETVKVTLHVPASYQYQCDVHPAVMTGTLVVVKEDET